MNRTNVVLGIIVGILTIIASSFAFDNRYAKARDFETQQHQIVMTQVSIQDIILQQEIQMLREEIRDIYKNIKYENRKQPTIDEQLQIDKIKNKINDLQEIRKKNFKQVT